MKKLYYSVKIPGKTFLTGEYLALYGGSSLIALTAPGFEVFFVPKEGQRPYDKIVLDLIAKHHLNPKNLDCHFLDRKYSPATLFYEKNKLFFQDWEILFYDEYNQRGGFGASTAQFLSLYQFLNFQQNQDLKINYQETNDQETNYIELIRHYWSCDQQAEPLMSEVQKDLKTIFKLPSGHDLVAQNISKVVRVGKHIPENDSSGDLLLGMNIRVQQLEWRFKTLDFVLVYTGHKLTTHEHLKTLDAFEFKGLEKIQNKVEDAFMAVDERNFISAVNEYYQELDRLGFVCLNTKEIINKSKQLSEILAIKGCGAMGSDVLFLLFHSKDKNKIHNWIFENNFKFIYDNNDLWHKPFSWQRNLWG